MGKLARMTGLHPYSNSMDMGFLMTTESQDFGLMSHPEDGSKVGSVISSKTCTIVEKDK